MAIWPLISSNASGCSGGAMKGTASRRMTAEELLMLPDDGMLHELIAGELRTMAPSGHRHGRVTVKFTLALGNYVEQHGLGEVWGAETGCILARNPDTVRAADVTFVHRERLGAGVDDEGFWPGAPDLVAEVRSPGDRRGAVADKVATWLRAGTRMVVVVDPQRRTVAVHRSDQPVTVLGEADTLDGGDVVPGWTLPVRALFA
jgi:Uma2 family endonuclease